MRKWSATFGLLATIAASMLSAQGPSTVLVRVETTAGNIDIAVDPAHAPITSANFLRYIAGGLYDGGEFYRAARPDTYHAVLPNRPPMELWNIQLIQNGRPPRINDSRNIESRATPG